MTHSPPSTLKTIADQIFADRRISRQIQQELMAALLNQPTLSRQEQDIAQRVFDAIRKGQLRVVD